jgi:hypothetical protein
MIYNILQPMGSEGGTEGLQKPVKTLNVMFYEEL